MNYIYLSLCVTSYLADTYRVANILKIYSFQQLNSGGKKKNEESKKEEKGNRNQNTEKK